ncbi:hypothetical protein [Neorhizobium tomejilense]|uniref:hypothetical protein n=1 Tax=Neorhizobium tomejilense TaxID=2093828 RepID=UPI003ECD3B18
MTQHISPSTLICTDLAIGYQSGIDLSVDMKPIGLSADMRRTWNGRLVNLADPAFRLYQIGISSGEGEIRAPALSRLWPGVEFQLVPPAELSDMIAPGGTSRTLQRTPYIPSIRVYDLAFNAVPFNVAGKVITLVSPAVTAVRIFFRGVYDLTVTEPWSVNTRASRAEVSWTLVSEETGGAA